LSCGGSSSDLTPISADKLADQALRKRACRPASGVPPAVAGLAAVQLREVAAEEVPVARQPAEEVPAGPPPVAVQPAPAERCWPAGQGLALPVTEQAVRLIAVATAAPRAMATRRGHRASLKAVIPAAWAEHRLRPAAVRPVRPLPGVGCRMASQRVRPARRYRVRPAVGDGRGPEVDQPREDQRSRVRSARAMDWRCSGPATPPLVRWRGHPADHAPMPAVVLLAPSQSHSIQALAADP